VPLRAAQFNKKADAAVHPEGARPRRLTRQRAPRPCRAAPRL